MKRRKSNLHHHRLKQHYSDLFIYLWDIAPGQLIAFPADGFSITLSIFNILSLWTLPYNTFLHYSFIVFFLNINPVFLSPAVHLLLLFWMSDREGSASRDETWRAAVEKRKLSVLQKFSLSIIYSVADIKCSCAGLYSRFSKSAGFSVNSSAEKPPPKYSTMWKGCSS